MRRFDGRTIFVTADQGAVMTRCGRSRMAGFRHRDAKGLRGRQLA